MIKKRPSASGLFYLIVAILLLFSVTLSAGTKCDIPTPLNFLSPEVGITYYVGDEILLEVEFCEPGEQVADVSFQIDGIIIPATQTVPHHAVHWTLPSAGKHHVQAIVNFESGLRKTRTITLFVKEFPSS